MIFFMKTYENFFMKKNIFFSATNFAKKRKIKVLKVKKYENCGKGGSVLLAKIWP